MNLQELLRDFTTQPIPDCEITGLETTSSRIKEGFLFFAIEGHRADGHTYIAQAVEAGAVAVIGTRTVIEATVPYLVVEDIRYVLAHVAKRFYQNPSASKCMIGITGTNGKTTTSFMLKEMLEASGLRCSLFGTVKYEINGEDFASLNTTPDSLQLQQYIHRSQDDVVIMEVSSHGIDQQRIEGLEFDYAFFTNLDHDHLDYHETMEAYFEVKARLFNQLKPGGKAVINTQNPWGAQLAERLEAQGIEILNVPHANLLEERAETTFPTIKGMHNRFNAAMAWVVAEDMMCTRQVLIQGLHSFKGVPGRFQLYPLTTGATVVIDYAHTAEAFEFLLQTAREEGARRIFHVFGFRGNRDRTKRQKMLDVSTRLSDVVILTVDDLNGLSIEELLAEYDELNYSGTVIPDRTEAIHAALHQASSGDWVIITGRGVEPYKKIYRHATTTDDETVLLYQQARRAPQ